MYNVIKAKFLEVRKAKDTNAIKTLSTLIGAIDMIAKNKQIEITNEIVFDAIVKMLKGVNETIPLVQDKIKLDALNNEKTLLESFMPKQMTEAELEAAIAEIVKTLDVSNKSFVGQVMKELKTKFCNQYDSKVANILISKLKK
jgi:uncharacterized protein YqeY